MMLNRHLDVDYQDNLLYTMLNAYFPVSIGL